MTAPTTVKQPPTTTGTRADAIPEPDMAESYTEAASHTRLNALTNLTAQAGGTGVLINQS
jgi:hypothetical protein